MFIDSIAYLLQYISEYKKAEELYKKSLRIRERVLGEEHSDTALSYNNLAGVYRYQGEYKIALTYFLIAYKVLVFRFGIKHPNTQLVYKNMKIAYREWGTEGNFEQWLEENMEK